ncbi:unnamed protein product, partial [marine sediment metagenome]
MLIFSPVEVVKKDKQPTSIPMNLPVLGSGLEKTLSQEKVTYQRPERVLRIVTVLISPSIGRER